MFLSHTPPPIIIPFPLPPSLPPSLRLKRNPSLPQLLPRNRKRTPTPSLSIRKRSRNATTHTAIIPNGKLAIGIQKAEIRARDPFIHGCNGQDVLQEIVFDGEGDAAAGRAVQAEELARVAHDEEGGVGDVGGDAGTAGDAEGGEEGCHAEGVVAWALGQAEGWVGDDAVGGDGGGVGDGAGEGVGEVAFGVGEEGKEEEGRGGERKETHVGDGWWGKERIGRTVGIGIKRRE